MNKQEIFDKVVRGLHGQGWQRSVAPPGAAGPSCRYRGDNGLKCAARDELAKRRGEDQIKVIREFFQNEPVESEIWEFISGFDSPEEAVCNTPAVQAGIRTHNAVKEAGLFK